MKRYLSADTFQRDCIRLAKKVFNDSEWHPDLLLALWRGGAQPGVIMSEVFAFLGRPVAHSIIKCSSYAGIGERTNKVVFQNAEELLEAIPPDAKVLVVDDVFDSGKTAEAVKLRLKKADVRIATVYWKPTERKVDFLPDYTVQELNEWIVFPHELDGLTKEELYTKDPEIADILFNSDL